MTAHTHELTVRREPAAQHSLPGPDPGPEGTPHSHYFTPEVCFGGPVRGAFGSLVATDDVEANLDDLEERYRDSVLDESPEFEGPNPGVECVARLFGNSIKQALDDLDPEYLRVREGETDVSWTIHTRRLDG
ncbi:MAG: 6-carboxytetrahydropterin synthase [Halohasta sp.]